MHFLLPLPFFQHAQSSLLGSTAGSMVVLSLEALVPGNWKAPLFIKKNEATIETWENYSPWFIKNHIAMATHKDGFPRTLLTTTEITICINMQRVSYVTYILKETSIWNPTIKSFRR